MQQAVRVPEPFLPSLPSGLTARPLTRADLDAVYAVYAAAEVEDSGHLGIEPEDIAGDWARPSFDLASDSVGVLDGDRIVAAGEVTRGGARAEGAVLPEARGHGIGSWLVAWTGTRAAAMGSSRVGQTTPDGSMPQRLLLAREHPTRPRLVGAGAAGGARGARAPAAGPVLAGDRGHGRTGARGTHGDPGRLRRVGGSGSGHLRGLGRDDGAAPRRAAVAARVVEHDGAVVGASYTVLNSRAWVSSTARWPARTVGEVSRRRCWRTPSGRPARRGRRAARSPRTHAPRDPGPLSQGGHGGHPDGGRTW